MADITVAEAKALIWKFLDDNQLPYTKITGRTVDFEDLARDKKIFVKIWGWKPNGIFAVIHKIAQESDFCVETDWGTA